MDIPISKEMAGHLARKFHELLSRDHEDGRATRQPQGVGSEAYLNGTSQVPKPEDARKDGHICGRSKSFMKYPGQGIVMASAPHVDLEMIYHDLHHSTA